MANEEIYEYYTLADAGYGEYREKGSKFMAYAYPVTTEQEVEAHLESLRKAHPKSRHYCYGYILDRYQQQYRANDDGEPSGTAGRPILGQLHSAEVVEAVVIVVRYFGGTKLGASGLIHAYKAAAEQAVKDAGKKLVHLRDTIRLDIGYDAMGHVLDCIKSLDIDIINKSFTDRATVEISLPSPTAHEQLITLKAKILNVSSEQIAEDAVVDSVEFEIVESFSG